MDRARSCARSAPRLAGTLEAFATAFLAIVEVGREEVRQAWRQHPLPEGKALRLWLTRYPEDLLEETAEELDELPEHFPSALNELERRLLVWVTPEEAVVPPPIPILRALQEVV